MSRKAITILVACAMFLFVSVALLSDSNAGESVAPVPVAGCAGSVQAGCAGSQPVMLVARWTPIRNLFTRARMRRAARGGCSGYSAPSGCSAPQAMPVMVQPVQVITVAPIRLFRSCVGGVCR